MWTIAVGWVLKNWKIVLPILLLVAALGYVQTLHWRIDYYKGKVTELTLAVKQGLMREEKLRDNAVALTAKYETRLATQAEILENQKNEITKRILADEETKRIRISRNVVKLFNDSKPKTEQQPTAETKPANDEGTSSDSTTLNQLLYVSAINDAAHELCRKTVKEWQSFWRDYVASYEKAVE